ncbi:KAT8 regulatory NSL complex subunit 1-like isoform X2 [Polyodon spathula]|uniref:KAT8 regulatory NSL complex subunit 1-like isoform X2 n=1 Tax=Polyodon spathula TaxID=7913 RepID=UPI001B7ED94D|nr:KAT8 regulatory NSL complex subunit 1-like isoform X2 [Polyodon spathula]
MAAMAPALTDAPAEAHHIRFKLATPSSTLSPGSVENNSNANNILISSNGTSKHKAIITSAEEHAFDFRGNPKEEQQRGKLQPLVASYLCSDVTSVATTKESRKLQGVIIKQKVLKSHSLLTPPTIFNSSDIRAELLARQHQALEFTGENLKMMSSSSQPVAPAQVPVNGLAKKLAKSMSSSARDGPAALAAVSESKPGPSVAPGTEACHSKDFKAISSSCTLLKGCVAEEQPPGNLPVNNTEQSTAANQLDLAEGQVEGEEGYVGNGISTDPTVSSVDLDSVGCNGNSQVKPTTTSDPNPFSTLDAEIRARTLLNQNRQSEIENRIRRLRKRLQVVQAKQVERHVQQQLGGFLQTSFAKLPSLDSLRQRSPAVLTRKAESALRRAASESSTSDGLSHFLKSGSVPMELERLSLSGTANLRAAEQAFDSDVTDSSSGGESDIEEEQLTKVDIEQRHISLWRRAEGRYAMERASIVSHWNWLQAHISDLEYRIRQQTDIYRQIRTNKGLIVLGEAPLAVEDGLVVKSESAGCSQLAQDYQCSETIENAPSPPNPTDAVLLKGCVAGRPVNGVVNSLHPGLPDPGSPDSSDTEELLNKKQHLNLLAPTPPDSTDAAARTRPILSCRKRRLVRPSSVMTLNRKVHKSSVSRCSCDINPSCVMCGNRSLPSTEFQYEAPLLERLSLFDPCIHPILSFPDDVSMNLHFQRTLKSHWQNKPLEKIKPLKKISLKHKMSMTSRLPDPPSKDKHRLSNSLLSAVRLSHHKIRPEKIHRQHLDNVLTASQLERTPVCKLERNQTQTPASYDKSHSKKRQRNHSIERTDAPRHLMDTGNPWSSLVGLHTPTHSPLRQLSTSSESSTPIATNSNPQPVRRRRGESSFDINNIVIPMSVAATTRVEKLQYKEIITPSWRKVDICAQPIAEEDDSVEIEDLSDTEFAVQHLKCEELERSRWTWTATAAAQRRGSRSYKSLDGRTTPLLGGTNPSTPQPASPDTAHFYSLQDFGPMPSPHSPASPDAISNPYTPGSRDSHRLQSSEDTRCSTPDFSFEEVTIQPWERRTFPLSSDPVNEPEDHCELQDWPMRGIRRISGCKSFSKESENETTSPVSERASRGIKPH